MSKIENDYIDNIDKIILTDERNKYLKIQTINRYYKNKKKNSIIFCLVAAFSILIVSAGVTYAEEIKDGISKVITKITNLKTQNDSYYTNYKLESEARKELNYNANLNEPRCQRSFNLFENISDDDACYSAYTPEELADVLGIKILKNDFFTDNRMLLTKVSRVDGNISYIKLHMPNPMNTKFGVRNQTAVWLDVAMRTKYNDKNIDTVWEANVSSENNIHEYYIKAINEKAYATYVSPKSTQNIIIIHDNIAYRLKVHMGTEDANNPFGTVQKILDGFHY